MVESKSAVRRKNMGRLSSELNDLNALVKLLRRQAVPCRNCKHAAGYAHSLVVGVNSCRAFFEREYDGSLTKKRLKHYIKLLRQLGFRFAVKVGGGKYEHYVRTEGKITQSSLDKLPLQVQGSADAPDSVGQLLSAKRLVEMLLVLQGNANPCRPPRGVRCNHSFSGPHGVVNGHVRRILILAFPTLSGAQVQNLCGLLSRFGFTRGGRFWIVSMTKATVDDMKAEMAKSNLEVSRRRAQQRQGS